MVGSSSFYAALGRQIQARRRGRLTQEELASRLDPPLTRAAIANIEAGKQGVLVYTLVQIAHQLGVQLGDLVPSGSVALSSDQLETALVEARVPLATSRRLTETLFAVPRRRDHGKRPARKSRR